MKLNAHELIQAAKRLNRKDIERATNEMNDLKHLAYSMEVGEEFDVFFTTKDSKTFKRIK